jgi:membrane protein DedA with SNARE-associated domain
MADLIIQTLTTTGYLGVALLMFLENVFPPIPSELIMPFAGFTAGNGQLGLIGVILAGTTGSMAGAYVWYWLAFRFGKERLKRFADRHGRWLTLTGQDIEQADAWFDRHCGKAVLLGRLVPTVRTLISVPAGLSGMSNRRFLIYTGIGTALWTSVLALAGYALGDRYGDIGHWIEPISNVIVALIVVTWLYRVITWRGARA